jgi:hypothetical protein
MTPDEMQAVERMHCVRYLPASWEKRFMRDLSSGETITEAQAPQLWRLFVRYRKQLPDFPDKARLLKVAESLAAPDLRQTRSRST